MIKVSVVIITLNEETKLGKCIDSVRDIADEVVVVDSLSKDDTPGIASLKGARFIQNPFKGYADQKNFALKQAHYDFILSLDADESLSRGLSQEIQRVKEDWTHDGYELNRLTNYCGAWIRHCGWYPDKKIRLFDRRKAHWGGGNLHERIILSENSSVKPLKGNILHYSFPDISSHLRKADHFSKMAAKQSMQQKRKMHFFLYVLINPLFTFIKKYFFQLGFLDGFYGFVICVLSAHANFLKYARIWQFKAGYLHPLRDHNVKIG